MSISTRGPSPNRDLKPTLHPIPKPYANPKPDYFGGSHRISDPAPLVSDPLLLITETDPVLHN